MFKICTNKLWPMHFFILHQMLWIMFPPTAQINSNSPRSPCMNISAELATFIRVPLVVPVQPNAWHSIAAEHTTSSLLQPRIIVKSYKLCPQFNAKECSTHRCKDIRFGKCIFSHRGHYSPSHVLCLRRIKKDERWRRYLRGGFFV